MTTVRAFVEINDACSPWPVANRQRLRAVDPTMYGIVERLLLELHLDSTVVV